MPTRKVTDYGVQVASGLAASHAKGIVHRDLKPENLFLTTDERVKILDFGLAKLDPGLMMASMETGVSGFENAETAAVGTQPGAVLGTLGYMAPEQVRGIALDHRADVFSFGAILYELLTGRRAFQGDTPADTMTAILKEEPPELSDVGTSVPVGIERVVKRCLEKNPAVRFQSASDLAFALQTVGSDSQPTGAAPAGAPPVGSTTPRASWQFAVLALILGAVLALGGRWLVSPEVTTPEDDTGFLSLPIAPPGGVLSGRGIALSPDGSLLAFESLIPRLLQRGAIATISTPLEQNPGKLWVRSLVDQSVRELDGTDAAQSPFWSPDGRSLGFFSEGKLRVITLEDEKIRVLADAVGNRTSGAWNKAGVILFSSEGGGLPIKQVNSDGRTEPVAASVETRFRPHFLPDQKHYLIHRRFLPGLFVGSLGSTEEQVLLEGAMEGKYFDGYLFFVRSNSLFVQPFDPSEHKLSGEAEFLAELGRYRGDAGINYSVAGNGLLAFASDLRGAVETHLVWRRRDGTVLGSVEGDGTWSAPVLSPGGRLLAAVRDQGRGTRADVWLLDLSSDHLRAIASSRYPDRYPTWWDREDRLGFTSGPQGGGELFEVDLSNPAVPERIDRIRGTFGSWALDRRHVVFFTLIDGNRDLIVLPLFGDREPFFFAQSPNNETQGVLSPDLRWMTYVSDETGQREIYVQAFPDGGAKQLVSGGGAVSVLAGAETARSFSISTWLGRSLQFPFVPTRTG